MGIGAGIMVAAMIPALSASSAVQFIVTSPSRIRPAWEDSAWAGPPLTERRQDRQVADPNRVVVPSIGVTADVVALGLEPDGTLEVPEDFDVTGWYQDGPEPGELGASVIVGHVDSYDGPAVFYRLGQLVPGDEVIVEAADGTSSTFVVERVEQYPKEQFPTQAVYGDTPGPTLRLITCGGTFDRGARSYRDNVVVFARLSR